MVCSTFEAGLFEELKDCYKTILRDPINAAAQIGEADIVVGIPFYDEVDLLPKVLAVAREGLKKHYPDKKCVIVAAGAPVGTEVLRAIESSPSPQDIGQIAFLLFKIF